MRPQLTLPHCCFGWCTLKAAQLPHGSLRLAQAAGTALSASCRGPDPCLPRPSLAAALAPPLCTRVPAHARVCAARPQVSLVDGKPIVCIDVGDGQQPDLQAVEEKLLAEMQSLTLKQGQAVAEQAQFIIVGSDLPPERTLSAISETPTLPMQASGGSALASGTQGDAVSAAQGSRCCLRAGMWRRSRGGVPPPVLCVC